MKKLLLLFAAVASLASCVQNIEGVDTSLGYTTITVGMPESRTSLGEKGDDGIYAIYWSEGDQIVANGAASTKMTIGENRKSATFHFEDNLLVPPYHLTYPYTANSACAEGKPTVVFAANQEYVANSFGVGYAPMCGYIESGEASMMHLAGVLQFKVKGTNKLSTIEIIAEEGKVLAGEFDVDCERGTLTAINGKVSNTITYTANQTLTADGTTFHITVPKGIDGVCKVVLTDSAGQKMDLKWTASNVAAGVVREFKEFEFKGGASFELEEMSSITDEIEPDNNGEYHDGVWGYLKYDDGKPAVGVSVSDGFSVVQTDENGFYQFPEGVDSRAYYIYYSIPSDARVTVSERIGASGKKNYYQTFFKRYLPSQRFYNFKLTRITKENNFSLFVIADTHGYTDGTVTRLKNECVEGILREAANKSGTPCYAVICGDIVCASTSSDIAKEKEQAEKFMPIMRNMFLTPDVSNSVPTFFVMGNHDHDWHYFKRESITEGLDEFNLGVQRAFEEKFAPANYSFNRGDTHIICMRNMLWPESSITNKTSSGEYAEFTNEQIAWLQADLANVTKDKKVILCVHIPLSDRYKDTYPSVKTVVGMIEEYNEPQIFSGHSHINRDIKAGSKNFELSCPVNEKSIVGNWGTGVGSSGNPSYKCMGDGSPFGFDVYDISGAQFTDHYYVDCTSNLSHNTDMDYVMRAYLSTDTYGGDCNKDGKIGRGTAYYFGFAKTTLLATTHYLHVNVFNGSPDTWTLKLYVNGSYAKTLTWRTSSKSNAWSDAENLTWGGNGGSGTYSAPWYPLGTYYGYSENSQDWWYIAYIANESTTTSAQVLNSNCYHKWDCSLSSSQLSAIQSGNFYIEATHTEFLVTRTYTTNKIFGQDDYNGYINYNPVKE